MIRTGCYAGLLLAAGCAGEEKEDAESATIIDCSWFENDNCWIEVRDAAQACADEDGTTGVFDATFEVCALDDGSEVHFTEAATEAAVDADTWLWDFAMFDTAGSECMRFAETDTMFSVTSSAGTFVSDVEGSNVVLTCPDETTYQMSAFAVFECDWNQLPGYSTTGSGGSSSFSFLGNTSLWSCSP